MAKLNIDISKFAGANFEELFLKAGTDKSLYDDLTFAEPIAVTGQTHNTNIDGSLKPTSTLFPVAKETTFTFHYIRPLPYPGNLEKSFAAFEVVPTLDQIKAIVQSLPIVWSNVTVVYQAIPEQSSEAAIGTVTIIAKPESLIYAGESVIEYTIPKADNVGLSGFVNLRLDVDGELGSFRNDRYRNLNH